MVVKNDPGNCPCAQKGTGAKHDSGVAAKAHSGKLARDLANAEGFDEFEFALHAISAVHSAEEASNDWWTSRLSLVLREPTIKVATFKVGDSATITIADVAALLKRFIARHRPIIVIARAAKDIINASRS